MLGTVFSNVEAIIKPTLSGSQTATKKHILKDLQMLFCLDHFIADCFDSLQFII